MLESTGEGIHVYDLAHRYFESAFSSRIRALAVRRVSVERTPYDAARAADFCRAVRGSLYSTVRDELKEAVSYHLADEAGAARRDAAAKDPSHFCSKVSYGFFQQRPLRHALSADRARAAGSRSDTTKHRGRGNFRAAKGASQALGRRSGASKSAAATDAAVMRWSWCT